ncbi:MAG: hypothetical protein AB1758_03410 [Candidatus Eremiobacterota bacterium]
MNTSIWIQPQPVNATDARRGYVARFDNLQEAMGFLKAGDTVDLAAELDPVVVTAGAAMATSPREGASFAGLLAEHGFNSGRFSLTDDGHEWTLNGPAGLISFQNGADGIAAVVADERGTRMVAISSQNHGILYQEF